MESRVLPTNTKFPAHKNIDIHKKPIFIWLFSKREWCRQVIAHASWLRCQKGGFTCQNLTTTPLTRCTCYILYVREKNLTTSWLLEIYRMYYFLSIAKICDVLLLEFCRYIWCTGNTSWLLQMCYLKLIFSSTIRRIGELSYSPRCLTC
jgi:hypothetical protein